MSDGQPENSAPEQPTCGLVMPISAIEDCSVAHWSDVRRFIEECLSDVGFKARLVSYADETAVIQKTIVTNLYSHEIVVCDVSCKNPNVMFELGMRLAFDKPTVVIKDDRTSYSFDTAVIEHLEYPRDLRYPSMVMFKQKLSKKVIATRDIGRDKPDYSPFLKHFGPMTAPALTGSSLTAFELIQAQLDEIRSVIGRKGRRALDDVIGDPLPPIDVKIQRFLRLLLSDASAQSDEELLHDCVGHFADYSDRFKFDVIRAIGDMRRRMRTSE